ncbi:MAG: LytTR family DNA-binding domain-containing protein [Pseudomonadota bacterium]
MLAIRTLEVEPRLLLSKAIGLSLLGWGSFLTCAALYCIVYNQFVLISPATFISSFIWSLKAYAPWLVITPLLAAQLRRIHQCKSSNFIILYAGLTIAALSAALIARVGLDIFFNPQLNVVVSAVNSFPAQLSVLGFVVIIWELLLHRGLLQLATQSAGKEITLPPGETSPRHRNSKVLVMKGRGECLIEWDSVDFISAAGNYMELTCATEKYLLRASMKQLEDALPVGSFIRIHRSYIVNKTAIDRIIAQPAGNGAIRLHNKHVLPLSKRYKQELNAYKFVPNSSQNCH